MVVCCTQVVYSSGSASSCFLEGHLLFSAFAESAYRVCKFWTSDGRQFERSEALDFRRSEVLCQHRRYLAPLTLIRP
jgi:hypothetical protein